MPMRWVAILLFVLAALVLPRVYDLSALSQPDIYLSSNIIPQGGLGLIGVKVGKGETPRVTWVNKEIYLTPNDQKTVWYGLIGVDLKARPGRYKILAIILPSGHKKHLKIKIVEKDYGVRRLTLPKKMVDLDAETLKRVKKESKIMKSLWNAPPSTPIWSGPFLRPIPGKVGGLFGRRSIINDQPRSPHSGVDLKGERGTPIKAVNNGKVTLTGDHFFSGKSVVIDHGGGIQSMYFHLDKIMAKEDEMIIKGQVIGLVGSTGRATGPHLHWGMRVNGARVDPLMLTGLSQQIEE